MLARLWGKERPHSLLSPKVSLQAGAATLETVGSSPKRPKRPHMTEQILKHGQSGQEVEGEGQRLLCEISWAFYLHPLPVSLRRI